MRKFIFLSVTILFSLACSGQMDSINRIPYTLFDDFETGELNGWEQYPYAEDIGFDALFSAHRTPTYKNSEYALALPVKANDVVELFQGFTKRIDLWTTSNTRIKVAVYFQSDRNPEKLELSLGTFDGRRYLHTINNPDANHWIELDIPIEEFRLDNQSLHAGEHVQVVTLDASYPIVYYLFTYTMLMDDFQIDGERQRQFIGTNPTSTYLDKFNISILNKHFFFGDNISLSFKPEGNIQLDQVKGKLVNSKGKVVKNNIVFDLLDNQWMNNSIYRLGKSDARGQWEIQLTGKSKGKPDVHWPIRFLVPGNKVNEHPRLFFSDKVLKNRLAKEQSPIAKKILNKALEDTDFMDIDVDSIEEGLDRTAENLVGGPYSKTSVGFDAYGEWNNPKIKLGTVIEEGSFRYAFTGDQKAGQKAKRALIKLCSFEKWNADWMIERKFWTYYPVGYTLIPVAYGYDMLYDLLTEAERKLVREAIIEKGLKLFHRDMVEMNRMPSNLTNHIAVLVGGHGLAATAIYGDEKDNPYLEPYLSGIMAKTRTFIDRTYYEDGSYGEPKSGYMNMATREIVLIMEAFERNFGVDWATTTEVENYYKYPLQATHPNGLMADFGDGNHMFYGKSGPSFGGFTEQHAEYFVYRTGNPYLYNYLKSYWENGEGGYLGYLWFRDDITPISRTTLPISKVFEAQGMVMRSGWEDPSTIISIRMGPHSNHYHFDQGSFQIMANGEELLTDPGVGTGGYYANLDYNIYNIQAIAHNVILVDHDPESQVPGHFDNDIKALSDWPRMTHTFTGKMIDVLEGDLSSVYKGKLKKYTRTFLYNKTGPLFLFDQVVSSSTQGHVYDWLFHAPENSIEYSKNRMTVDRPNARLTLDVISPTIQSSRIRNNKDDGESFITLTSKPNLTEANFLAVIIPEAKPVSGDYESVSTIRIEQSGWVGAKVERNNTIDFGLFRTKEGTNTIEGFTTDGNRIATTVDKKGNLISAYFEGSFLNGHEFSVKANLPITFAISFAKSDIDIEVQNEKSTKLDILLEHKPSRILVNGVKDSSWEYNNQKNTLTIEVSEGKSNLIINQ